MTRSMAAVLFILLATPMLRAEPTRSTSMPDLSPTRALGMSISLGGRADRYVLGGIASTELWIDWAVLPQLKLGGAIAAGTVYFDGDESEPGGGSYLDNTAVWARGIHRWSRPGATVDGGFGATVRLPTALGLGYEDAAAHQAPMFQLARRPLALAASDPAVSLDADLQYSTCDGHGRVGVGVVMIGDPGPEVDAIRIGVGAGTRLGSRWELDGALHVALHSRASGGNGFTGFELGLTLRRKYSWSLYWPVLTELGATGLLTFGIHGAP